MASAKERGKSCQTVQGGRRWWDTYIGVKSGGKNDLEAEQDLYQASI